MRFKTNCLIISFLCVQMVHAIDVVVPAVSPPVATRKANKLKFHSYTGYLSYLQVKNTKGHDSARAFYLNELISNPSFVDYLPLTAGSSFPLTGTLVGTSATFNGLLSTYINLGAAAKFNVNAMYPAYLTLQAGGSDKGYIQWNIGADQNSGGTEMFINNVQGKLNLFDNTNAGLTIASGKVGIGTVTPTSKLVVSGYATDDFLTSFDNTKSAGHKMYFGYNNGTNTTYGLIIDGGRGNALQPDFRVTGKFNVMGNGNVGIGSDTPSHKLTVRGSIYSSGVVYAENSVHTKKVIVNQTEWPDYVFDKEYELTDLNTLDALIQKNKHLPGIPSATEVKKSGISLGDNQALLLKKIEELTLYIIQQEKRIAALEIKSKKK